MAHKNVAFQQHNGCFECIGHQCISFDIAFAWQREDFEFESRHDPGG